MVIKMKLLSVIVFVFGLQVAVAQLPPKHPIIHTDHAYLNIMENAPIGTQVVMIDASSQTNDLVIVKTYDNATRSRVDLVPVKIGINSTYKVVTTVKPDREVEWTWYLSFEAHDRQGSTLWTLPLHIDDVNDNPPVFEHEHYHGVIGFSTPVGTKVLHAKATDADQGANSAISYSLTPRQVSTGSNRYNPFTINAFNGDITLKEALHHGELNYHYYIVATDHGRPQFNTTATLDIGILDLGAIGRK